MYFPFIIRGLILIVFLTIGCTSLESETATYDAVHQHATKELPWAVSLERKFPHTDHFITHYGMTGPSQTWNSVSYFGGRYELTIQVDVNVDYKSQTFHATGRPKGYLVEVGLVRGNGGGKVANDMHLTDEQLEGLIENNWDFEAIGITLNPAPVENFELFERSWRAPRRPISLEEELNGKTAEEKTDK